MDIIHKKNQLLSLVQNIVNDYQSLNDTFMEQKQNSLQEIQKLNSLIHEQEANVQKQQSLTQTDESEIHRLKKQCYEYEEMIRKLEDKLNEKDQEKTENNKFNMMIAQANELEAKDREIERLNKLVLSLKHPKKDISLISSKKNSPVKTSLVDSIVTNVKDELQKDKEIEEIEEKKVLTFLYRKKTYYYLENNPEGNGVFDSEELKTCIGTWGQTKSGKMKFISNK